MFRVIFSWRNYEHFLHSLVNQDDTIVVRVSQITQAIEIRVCTYLVYPHRDVGSVNYGTASVSCSYTNKTKHGQYFIFEAFSINRLIKFYSRADAINKCLTSTATLCWIKALWLAATSHATSLNRLECFISKLQCYSKIYLWHRLLQAG